MSNCKSSKDSTRYIMYFSYENFKAISGHNASAKGIFGPANPKNDQSVEKQCQPLGKERSPHGRTKIETKEPENPSNGGR